MHERLRTVYNLYVTRFLDEKTRKDYQLEPDLQRLVLPGEEGTDGECDFSLMFEEVKIKAEALPSNNQSE